MTDDEKTERIEDGGGVGAEGGEGESADKAPAAPSKDDDTPLGDTDQHSEVPPPPRTGR